MQMGDTKPNGGKSAHLKLLPNSFTFHSPYLLMDEDQRFSAYFPGKFSMDSQVEKKVFTILMLFFHFVARSWYLLC